MLDVFLMDERQETVVDDNIKAIIDCIQANLTNMLLDFVKNGGGPTEMRVFSVDNIHTIESKGIPKAQTQELIRMLKQRDQGFTALTTALTQYGRNDLADKLIHESSHTSNFNSEDTAIPSRNSQMESKAYPEKHAKLPKPWNAPYRQQRFVGRNNFLRQLDELQNASFKESKHSSRLTHILAVCTGLGGIGKSSIALQFIYQNLDRYYYVFWIPATTCEGIENCLAQLGAQLCLPINNSNVQMWKETTSWLQANPGWLMMFDDAPNFSVIESYIPRTGGYALVTSRYTEWPCQTLNITPFTNEETTEYVELILTSAVDKTECAALADALGNLPLAISQASAYMSKLRISVPEYLVKLKAAQGQLLSSTILPPDCKSKSVYFTWNVSVQQARQECGFAAELLAFCSLLDISNVPENLTCEFAKVRNCSKLLEEAQAALFSYSLMSISSSPKRGMSMHPLVQAVTRSNLSNCEVIDYVKNAFTCIENVWPDEPQLNHNIVRALYPSLESCLHYMRLEGEACENPPRMLFLHAQHKILQIAETAYEILGNYTHQHAILKRKKKSAKLTGTILHDELLTAQILYHFGNACGNIGHYNKRLKHLLHALDIQKRHYGSDHVKVAHTFGSLGNAYGSLGDYPKQKELLEKALVIKEKHYGPDHSQVASTLYSLGHAYGTLGGHHKQKELLEKALVITERHYGPDHTRVAATLHELGNAYGSLGDNQKQKELLEKALAIQVKHYGPGHTWVGAILHSLGYAYGSLGDYQKHKEPEDRKQFSVFDVCDGCFHCALDQESTVYLLASTALVPSFKAKWTSLQLSSGYCSVGGCVFITGRTVCR